MREVHDLLTAGDVLGYETRLRGEPLISYWLTYRGAGPNQRHRFELRQIVRMDARKPRSRIKAYGIFETTPDFRPRRYDIRTQGSRFLLDIESGTARATSSESGAFPAVHSDPTALLPANSLSILSIALALRDEERRRAGAVEIDCFIPESMMPFTYSVRREGACWRSNLGEMIEFSEEGFIARLHIDEHGVSAERIARAQPRWTIAPKDDPVPPSCGVTLPLMHNERRIAIPRPAGSVAGVICYPRADREPQAAALFLGGSGLYDRDGRTGSGFDLGYGTICRRLAEHGIVSLRYDKPGAGETKRDASLEARYDDVVETAALAYETLRTSSELSDRPSILIGHSQGGLVALELAAKRAAPDVLILLATAARPIDAIIREQISYQLERVGVPESHATAQLEDLNVFFESALNQEHWTPETVPGKIYMRQRARLWYKELLARDPIKLAKQVSGKILIVQGEQDIQVRPREASMLAEAIRQRGGAVEVLMLPQHDHLFRKVRASDPLAGYFDRRRKIDRRVIDKIAVRALGLLND